MDITRILVPVDFSHNSDDALAYAEKLARTMGASIHLLHVVELPPTAYSLAAMPAGAFPAEVTMEGTHRELEELVSARGLTCTTSVRLGNAADQIVACAGDMHSDLIVMGTHGRRGLARLLIGSTTETVVRTAPCPVLSIRPLQHAVGAPA